MIDRVVLNQIDIYIYTNTNTFQTIDDMKQNKLTRVCFVFFAFTENKKKREN